MKCGFWSHVSSLFNPTSLWVNVEAGDLSAAVPVMTQVKSFQLCNNVMLQLPLLLRQDSSHDLKVICPTSPHSQAKQ